MDASSTAHAAAPAAVASFDSAGHRQLQKLMFVTLPFVLRLMDPSAPFGAFAGRNLQVVRNAESPSRPPAFHSFRRNLDPIIRSSRPCPWIRPLRRPATGPVSMASYLIALSDRFETGIARTNPGCHRAAQHIFYSCPCNVAPLKTRGPMTPGGNALANGRGRFASRVFMRSRTFGNALSIRQLPGGRHLPENHPQQYWIETVSTGTNRCRG